MKARYRDKEFGSRKELFAFLHANKAIEIMRKKSIVHHSDPVLNKLIAGTKLRKANKEILYANNDATGILQRSLLVNTYLWRDSHYDVHLPSTFTRSIDQKGTNIPPIDQHKFDLDYIIGETLSITEEPFDWSFFGVDHSGSTTGVVANVNIMQSKSPNRYQDYLNDRIKQHSVGMIYMQCALAMDDKDYPLEYDFYHEWIDKIGNQQDVEGDGFFYGVIEAKLLEYSCVIAGSNELTGVLYPPKGTKDSGEEYVDPSNDTPLKSLMSLSDKLELRNKLYNLNFKLNGKE